MLMMGEEFQTERKYQMPMHITRMMNGSSPACTLMKAFLALRQLDVMSLSTYSYGCNQAHLSIASSSKAPYN